MRGFVRSFIDRQIMPWAFAGKTPFRTWLATQQVIRYIRATNRQ